MNAVVDSRLALRVVSVICAFAGSLTLYLGSSDSGLVPIGMSRMGMSRGIGRCATAVRWHGGGQVRLGVNAMLMCPVSAGLDAPKLCAQGPVRGGRCSDAGAA